MHKTEKLKKDEKKI